MSNSIHGRRWGLRHLWWLVASVLIVAGVIGSAAVANTISRRASQLAANDFEHSSSEVAAAIRLAIQREDDLVVSASGFLLANPDATNTEFHAWAASVQAMQRYPELLGWAEVVIVPGAQLTAFAAAVAADPSGTATTGSLTVVPPGDRSYYCLTRLAQYRDPTATTPAGFDFCAGPTGLPTLASRDSGLSGYRVVNTGNGNTLAAQVPLYRGGIVPDTLALRRAAFVGWMGVGFDAKAVLTTVLSEYSDTSVRLRFHDTSSDVSFTSGATGPDRQSLLTDLDNGWSVQVFGDLPASGIRSSGAALLVLISGIAVSVMLAVLVLVLGSGRARAVHLVAERTGQLRHQALHDSLTGLPNRALIMDRIEQLLARARRNRTVGAALFIDLDDFKNVNDTLGHEAGDRLLIAVAGRLTSALRDVDTIGRMGGDEFVVLIDGAQLTMAPELVAERLLDVMRQPFLLDGDCTPLVVNTSIGIAVGDTVSGGELLRDADIALYQAKGAGKNTYAVFDPAVQSAIGRRVRLEFDLRAAVALSQFRIDYQAIYSLDDLSIVGAEALVRWDHPALGLIEPDEFVPLLEQTGLIEDVGRWVLDEACVQTAHWHAVGHSIDVSVNISGGQLNRDEVVAHIAEALAISGLPASSLVIDVAETALMHNSAATTRRLREIKALGVRIAVDDFGTGYSSLAYLQSFPVNCIKVDRSFIAKIATSPESKALVSTLVRLGTDLGFTTLAEGVETPDQMQCLTEAGVAEAQGFLLAHPLDPRAFESRLLMIPDPTARAAPRIT